MTHKNAFSTAKETLIATGIEFSYIHSLPDMNEHLKYYLGIRILEWSMYVSFSPIVTPWTHHAKIATPDRRNVITEQTTAPISMVVVKAPRSTIPGGHP